MNGQFMKMIRDFYSLLALIVAPGFMLLLAHAVPAAAQEGFENSAAGYNQCVMWAVRNTRSLTAVKVMQHACQKVWYEGAMMSESDKDAYVCLLHELRGVDNDDAARLVYVSCTNQR
jgi:hypothetical protein